MGRDGWTSRVAVSAQAARVWVRSAAPGTAAAAWPWGYRIGDLRAYRRPGGHPLHPAALTGQLDAVRGADCNLGRSCGCQVATGRVIRQTVPSSASTSSTPLACL